MQRIGILDSQSKSSVFFSYGKAAVLNVFVAAFVVVDNAIASESRLFSNNPY